MNIEHRTFNIEHRMKDKKLSDGVMEKNKHVYGFEFGILNLEYIWNLVLEICDLRRTPFQQHRFIRARG